MIMTPFMLTKNFEISWSDKQLYSAFSDALICTVVVAIAVSVGVIGVAFAVVVADDVADDVDGDELIKLKLLFFNCHIK